MQSAWYGFFGQFASPVRVQQVEDATTLALDEIVRQMAAGLNGLVPM